METNVLYVILVVGIVIICGGAFAYSQYYTGNNPETTYNLTCVCDPILSAELCPECNVTLTCGDVVCPSQNITIDYSGNVTTYPCVNVTSYCGDLDLNATLEGYINNTLYINNSIVFLKDGRYTYNMTLNGTNYTYIVALNEKL